MRELADYNPALYSQVIRCPLGEVLEAYEHRLRTQAQHDFELRSLIYAIQNSGMSRTKNKAPEPPAILTEN